MFTQQKPMSVYKPLSSNISEQLIELAALFWKIIWFPISHIRNFDQIFFLNHQILNASIWKKKIELPQNKQKLYDQVLYFQITNNLQENEVLQHLQTNLAKFLVKQS